MCSYCLELFLSQGLLTDFLFARGRRQKYFGIKLFTI